MPNADLQFTEPNCPGLLQRTEYRFVRTFCLRTPRANRTIGAAGRAEEALASVHDILRILLEPNEAVLYVIKSCQAPLGNVGTILWWYVYRVTATRLVFTNLRLLHFGVGPGGKWNRTLESVRWGDVTNAKIKGWINRLLQFRYANGTKERYWRLPKKDGKKAPTILEAVLPLSRSGATPAQGFLSICPDCRAALTAGNYQCSTLKFKDEKKVRWRTMLIPGGDIFIQV